jgi:hypothetical protein
MWEPMKPAPPVTSTLPLMLRVSASRSPATG